MNSNNEKKWYALSVYSRKEKSATEDLKQRGFEIYLPVRKERRAWSDRIKEIEQALFPGYLFVHTDLNAQKRIELLKSPPVVELVGRLPGDEKIAQSISDAEIESLKIIIQAKKHLDPTERLIKGTQVLIGAGPLKGVSGIVEQAPDGKSKLVVQIELLGRGVKTELSVEDVVEIKAI